MTIDYLIVGAGFCGSTLAERLARVAGRNVLLIDERRHIGGNAYDHYNEDGVLVHKYGPHIFHTNSTRRLRLLVAVHRVAALRASRQRIGERHAGADADQSRHHQHALWDAAHVLRSGRVLRVAGAALRAHHPSEDVIVSKVGRELYEKFFSTTRESSGGSIRRELDAQVTARIPVRSNRDDRYFTDTYQTMPLHGYTRMFERMLDHPSIKVLLKPTTRRSGAWCGARR